MRTQILVDMDGVITDFVNGALRIHNWTWEAMEQVWPVGQYDMAKPMGLTEDQFWEPIHKMHEVFWMGLQPLPWAHELMDLVESVTDDWYIVSAPSRDPCSYSGKAYWLNRFFGGDSGAGIDFGFDRFVPTPRKHLLATGRNVLLIDDREENVKKFVEAGGRGLIFPSRHNRLHTFVDKPVQYVQDTLQIANWVEEKQCT